MDAGLLQKGIRISCAPHIEHNFHSLGYDWNSVPRAAHEGCLINQNVLNATGLKKILF